MTQNCGLSSDVSEQIVFYGILIRRHIWAVISIHSYYIRGEIYAGDA